MVNDWIVWGADFLLAERLSKDQNSDPAPILKRLQTQNIKTWLEIFDKTLGA